MKYVGTYSDPKDIVTKDKLEAVASRVSTNEDNIAMAESDIEGLQTTVGTLQTNVNNVQTALTSKQDTVVGGASTITENNLTASRALISNSSGKVAVSAVTSTELGYLDGVTSNVQTQLSSKQPTISATGILKGTGDGNVEAAVPGTDYLAESDLYICTVTASGTSYTADKTPQQIITAVSAGKIAVATLKAGVYFLAAGNTQFVQFTRTNGATVETLLVADTGTATLTTTNLQQSAIITNLEANKTSNTTYPSSKAVYDAIPHPDTKTDSQTQTVGVDTSGKLWTNASAVTSVNGKTGNVNIPTVFTINVDYENKSDKTFEQIQSAYEAGNICVMYDTDGFCYILTYLFRDSARFSRQDSGDMMTAEFINGNTKFTFSNINLISEVNFNTALDSYYPTSKAVYNAINTALNRTNAVNVANSNYTTYMARGEALFSTETVPSANGTIAWTYA